MPKVYNSSQAADFFLTNSNGNVLCIKPAKEEGKVEQKEVASYPEAKAFFDQKEV